MDKATDIDSWIDEIASGHLSNMMQPHENRKLENAIFDLIKSNISVNWVPNSPRHHVGSIELRFRWAL